VRWWWVPPAVVLGAAVGLTGLVVHRHALWLEGWPLPWGLALAVAAPAAVGVGLRGRQPAQLGYLLGWLSVLTVALEEGPGGDFVLLSDVLGWGFLGVTMPVIAVVLGVGAVPRRRSREGAAR
jgi:hypothetical protein